VKAKGKCVNLRSFLESRPEYEQDMLEFDEDEMAYVLPFGALPRSLVEESIDLKAEDGMERAYALRIERATRLIRYWVLRKPDGSQFGDPTDPATWNDPDMSVNLQMVLSNLPIQAYENREDKRMRAGEGSNSSTQLTDLEHTVSLTS
jgi:hypothetical protein